MNYKIVTHSIMLLSLVVLTACSGSAPTNMSTAPESSASVAARIVDKFRHSEIADTRRYAGRLEDAYARALAIASGTLAR